MAAVALVVILSASVVNANAQMRYMSPEQIAEIRSARMARELNLSASQYAKLYKLNLREARRMERHGAFFFDCEDYRCDLLRIIGDINYRLYESMVHNHRKGQGRAPMHAPAPHAKPAPHAPHAAPAPHAKPAPHAAPAPAPAPHAKPQMGAPAPNKGGAGKPEVGKPNAGKPSAGKPDGGKPNGGNGGAPQGRPQYRMK